MKKKEMEEIKENFSFKISPTIAAIVEADGEAEFMINDRYYKLIREDLFESMLKQREEEVLEEVKERIRVDNKLPTHEFDGNTYFEAIELDLYLESLKENT